MPLAKEQKQLLQMDLASLEEYAKIRRHPKYKTPAEYKLNLIAEASAYPDLLKGPYQDPGMLRLLSELEGYKHNLSRFDYPNVKGSVALLNTLNAALHTWISGDDTSVDDIKLKLGLNADMTTHDLVNHIHKLTLNIEKYYQMIDRAHAACKEKKAEVLKRIQEEPMKILREKEAVRRATEAVRRATIDSMRFYIKIDNLIQWLNTQTSMGNESGLQDLNAELMNIKKNVLDPIKRESEQGKVLLSKHHDELFVAHKVIDETIKQLRPVSRSGVIKRFVEDKMNPRSAVGPCIEAWDKAERSAAAYQYKGEEISLSELSPQQSVKLKFRDRDSSR